MVTCPMCGADNPAEAKTCNKCGEGLGTGQPPTTRADQTAPRDKFAKDMDEFGKRIGDAIEKDFIGWWDRTFGLLGPVIAGVLTAFAFLVLVLVVGAVEASADEPLFWDELGDFLLDYAWLFVGWGFVGGFQNYLNRKHRRTFRWISPVITAVGFTIFFWGLSRVMLFAGIDFEKPDLVSQSDFVDDMLPVIFALVAAVGYVNSNYERIKEKADKT